MRDSIVPLLPLGNIAAHFDDHALGRVSWNCKCQSRNLVIDEYSSHDPAITLPISAGLDSGPTSPTVRRIPDSTHRHRALLQVHNCAAARQRRTVF